MACAAAPPRSPLLERVGRSDLSVAALRVQVRDLARRLPGMLEAAADGIAADSDSREVHRAMLAFKSNGVPILQATLLQPDPVAGLVDAWALLAQLQDALPRRAARAPPAQVRQAQRELEAMESEVMALWEDLSGHEDISHARALIHQWATEHPLTGSLTARESTAPLLATVSTRSGVSPLGAAAVLLEDARDLTTRMDLYAASLPRQARWQAELAASDAADLPVLGVALGELKRAVDLLGQLDALAAGVPALVSRERAAVLSELEQERRSLQAFVSAERQALMGDVDRERAAVMADLRAERVAALQQLDGLARGWVDHAFGRAARLLGLVCLAVFVLLLGVGVVLAVARGRWGRAAG
ncbi:Methyl-accepting chemotaxis protein [Myxococcus hansupus]|uniref:Methyl-accepting chemotaxis protein n=2 Tax=Pseudomyxococcus hansupus TaxID=1297742 RepID=A0A0H4X6H0_9BACT|nr:Methyl-accepting chemotaxis protein [Myxococcus hansupus]